MIFARYNRIIQIAFFLVISVILFLFYWQFNNQYQYEVEELRYKIKEVVTLIDREIETAENYVEQMQLRASSFYDISQVTALESLLVDNLREEQEKDLIRYHLDHIPEPYNSRLVGNLTGIGTLQEQDSQFYQEIEMALSINPLLQTAFQLIPNTLWAYYLSSNNFLNLYPWVDSKQVRFSPNLLTSDVYTLALPENNSQHQLFWTPVHINPVTHQWIVSCGAPVYENDQFRGSIALDFTLDSFKNILQKSSPVVGHFLLINDRQQLIAVDQLNHNLESHILTLETYLPKALYTKIDHFLQEKSLKMQDSRTNILIYENSNKVPWKLIFFAKKTDIITPIFLQLCLGFGLFLIGLILLFILVTQLIQREFINPANQLIEHIEALSQNQSPQAVDVPEDWLHWFDTISNIFRDNQKMTTELVQREKMSSLGQLVAGIAHEVNNPINFIYGNLNYVRHYSNDLLGIIDLYQKYYPHPDAEITERCEEVDLLFLREDLPKLVQSMEVGAERIREIVLSLRNFSRLDESDKKRVNIHHGLESTLMIVENRLKTLDHPDFIKINKQYQDLPLIECYAGLMNQVFLNILSNAIDAVIDSEKEEKKITIATQCLGEDQIQIRIIDNGQGIPESAQDHIFEPFFTTKPVGKGTGLGLSVSYQIVVDRHHGSLKYHSTLGEGTEFIITIPISRSSTEKRQ